MDFADFANNQFTGFLPESIFSINTIRIVYFANNNFIGSIPENFGGAPNLRDLYLNGNQLTGTVPNIQTGQLTALSEFLLQDNEIGGVMPANICSLLSPNGMLEDLWADCGEIDCDCCTQCF